MGPNDENRELGRRDPRSQSPGATLPPRPGHTIECSFNGNESLPYLSCVVASLALVAFLRDRCAHHTAECIPQMSQAVNRINQPITPRAVLYPLEAEVLQSSASRISRSRWCRGVSSRPRLKPRQNFVYLLLPILCVFQLQSKGREP